MVGSLAVRWGRKADSVPVGSKRIRQNQKRTVEGEALAGLLLPWRLAALMDLDATSPYVTLEKF